MSVTWNDSEANKLFSSREMRQVLDGVAFTISAHAVPHSGVDTGRLTQSMGHSVEQADDGAHLVARLGSGLGDGSQPISYWSYHWANRPAPDQAQLAEDKLHLPHRSHPTKPAPTTPYASAMRELGIDFQIEPGGYEA